ncbi:hypothetical protein SLEP1_g4992 [Rubroshorea leprosula]|uniref:Uncharacterized protein n=1 Tax=Rubroshorea leprosula TaxID=152421 RepID=A0AAV5HQU5_9ROSI|nr:hypothetical protein SLEP1_g4992 [Rubroshorea leprosula]
MADYEVPDPPPPPGSPPSLRRLLALPHECWPASLKLQPVRPQNLPDQPVEAWNERELPFVSSNPVLSSLLPPELARIPGQTCKGAQVQRHGSRDKRRHENYVSLRFIDGVGNGGCLSFVVAAMLSVGLIIDL